VFLSRDAVWVMSKGCGASSPQEFSRLLLPLEMLSIDPAAVTVSMAYDLRLQGIWLFISYNDETASTHYFIDWKEKSFWPVSLQTGHEPFSIFNYPPRMSANDSGVLVGGRDGIVRQFQSDLAQDDGDNAIASYIDYGPFKLSRDGGDGILTSIQGVTAAGSGDVDWVLRAGHSAEAAFDQSAAGQKRSGEWNMAGLNPTIQPRIRGAACVLRLSNGEANSRWSVEEIVLEIKHSGRRRFQ
jgi:hypothetical protein